MAGVHFASAADTATVHGVIYEWDTFEPLENVIVEVNSTPPQSMLARYGLYSFNLAPGNYVISASYYRNDALVYDTQEEITIIGSGDYVIDIIFLPTYYESDLSETEFAELDELADLAENDGEGPESSFSYGTISLLVLTALALVTGAYLLARSRKGHTAREDDHIPADETSFRVSDEYAALPDDLREMVGIISRHGGRITQKELRGVLKHSEAKVSLMVSDLENRGVVQKFKKGRGNVIVLVYPQRDEAERALSEGPNQNI
jgi:uncharacterized membrane protein